MMRNFFDLDETEPQELIEDYMVEVSNNELTIQDDRDMAYYFFEYANSVYDDLYDVEDAVIVEDYDEPVLEMVKVESKPKSKRDELLESLSYLKSKKNKSKQDRESIYTLEMVLRNMK